MASQEAVARPAVIALIGNPNTGKTSLFNALTGYRRRVANYPGTTVETARAPLKGPRTPLELLDLPGTYSLAAISPDEMLVSNAINGRLTSEPPPACILAIVDAANLPRNLYLVSQLLEIGLPLVVAVNMVDIARSRGIEIDCAKLSQRLGAPVVPVVAPRQETIPPLVRAIEAAVGGTAPAARVPLPTALTSEIAALRGAANCDLHAAEALRVLLDRDGYAEQQFLAAGGSREPLEQARQRLAAAGVDAPAEVRARYAWVNQMLEGVIARPATPVTTWSERLDRVLTHKLWGALTLLIVLAVVFQAIFKWAEPVMDFINDGLFGRLGKFVAAHLSDGWVQSLIVDGLIAGVGGVLVFLPQIVILFALIAILEDSGYIARAAFMMDRIMRAAGLSGRAFIPLLSSFACAIPAIMGTRVIGDRRERFITILLAPFMSCSARLPVYVLLIGAFVPQTSYLGGWIGLPGLVMLAMYLIGVVVAVPLAWLLRKTAFAGGPPPAFLLELPSYKLPRLRTVWQRMWFAGRNFVVRAGTIILLVNLTVWALGYFPRNEATAARVQHQAAAEGWSAERTEKELAGAYVRESFLGKMGHAIEPALRPLGWDWRIGMAVIASFPAREVVVATLGTIFNLGREVEGAEESPDLRDALKQATWPETGKPVFTLPVALSLMVFFALCAQCASTLVVIGRETGSWTWPVVSFVGMTTIAYFAAWAVAAAARAFS